MERLFRQTNYVNKTKQVSTLMFLLFSGLLASLLASALLLLRSLKILYCRIRYVTLHITTQVQCAYMFRTSKVKSLHYHTIQLLVHIQYSTHFNKLTTHLGTMSSKGFQSTSMPRILSSSMGRSPPSPPTSTSPSRSTLKMVLPVTLPACRMGDVGRLLLHRH